MAQITDETAPQAPPSVRGSGGLSLQTFVAFGSRPFRYLWLNTFTFTLANGIQRFAFVWLALELSEKSIVLGAVSFALGAPILLISLPAGVLIDRLDRRLILFGSQIFGLASSLVAALLIWADVMSIGLALGMAFVLGGAVAVGQPARQAIVPTIVEPKRLLNAITLTTMSQNLSQLAGPAIGGVAIAIWGIGGSFVVQGVLLGIGLVALLPLKVPAVSSGARRQRPRLRADIAEGIRFVSRTADIRTLMILLLVGALLIGGPWTTLLPKLAKEELGVEAFGASMLFAAMGLGTLIASLWLASMGHLKNAGGWFIATMLFASLMIIGLGLSKIYALTIALMFISGLDSGFFMNLNLTLIQANTPQAVMGRVMSIYGVCFMGGMPVGALLAGLGAQVIGAPAYFAACGVVMAVLTAGAFLSQPSLRRMSTVPPSSEATEETRADSAAG